MSILTYVKDDLRGICYDHFLLKHWDSFTREPLQEFLRSAYASLSRMEWDFPPKYKYAIPFMIQHNWLFSYRTLEGVDMALTRMSHRFSRPTTLPYAITTIKQCYETLEQDFLQFFPDLVTFVQNGMY